MKKLLIFISVFFPALMGHAQSMPDSSVLGLRAPDTFRAEFQTTAGSFTIKAHRDWSPAGVDRLYQLVKSDFFTDVAIFRVQPEYVVQFGISDDLQIREKTY